MENLVIPLVSTGRVERGCVWRDSFIPLVSSGRVKRGCVWRDSFIPLVSSGREERLCLRRFVYTSSVFVSCRCKCVILFATMLHSLLSFSHLFIEREGMLMQILLLWFGEHTLKVFYFLLYEKNCVISRIFYPFRITSIFFHFFNRYRFFLRPLVRNRILHGHSVLSGVSCFLPFQGERASVSWLGLLSTFRLLFYNSLIITPKNGIFTIHNSSRAACFWCYETICHLLVTGDEDIICTVFLIDQGGWEAQSGDEFSLFSLGW